MIQIAAHRGGNSWSSLLEAIQKGYDYVELDVHLTKDMELIVQYSPKIEVDGKSIFIGDITFRDLPHEEKKGLILLQDVLEYTRDKISVVIDIKKGPDFYSEIGKKTAELIQKTNAHSFVWLISFDHHCLVEAKKHDFNIRIAPMYVARPYDEEKYWNSLGADGAEICNEYLTCESVQLAHRNNLKLLGWCTEDTDELQRLVSLGIDIITIEQDDRYYNLLRTLERNAV